tara:strand:- start:40 stop:621 length:582 start_codon:yes stop_codon:yes gene_type:complete
MEGWEAYQMYLGLKLHFTTDYDYNRYGGKTSASKASFLKRKDRYFFSRVAKKYDDKTLDYYVSNFVKSPKGWLGDFKEENYLEWSKNKQSLTYNFITDMSFLFTIVDNFDSIFSCQNGQHPVLLKNFLAKRITVETMVILQGLLNYIRQWDKELKDDLVWPDNRRLIVKYSAFLNYDEEKCKTQLLKLIKETF